MKHINKIATNSYFIDRYGKLSIPFMFYQMQNSAWEHANVLGFGYNKLKDANQFWVLARLKIKINSRPQWSETFNLETWSRGTDGFYGYRDFNFVDSYGNSVIQATSSWLVLEADSRRIVRLSKFKEFPAYTESIFGSNASKIKSPDSNESLHFNPVLFSEIDINQHFNSGRYLERIINSYSFEFHEKYDLVQFELNFLKEGLPTDRLAVKKQHINLTECLCSVVRESDGIDLMRAKLQWKEKE